jgi:hypothetical protein
LSGWICPVAAVIGTPARSGLVFRGRFSHRRSSIDNLLRKYEMQSSQSIAGLWHMAQRMHVRSGIASSSRDAGGFGFTSSSHGHSCSRFYRGRTKKEQSTKYWHFTAETNR